MFHKEHVLVLTGSGDPTVFIVGPDPDQWILNPSERTIHDSSYVFWWKYRTLEESWGYNQ